MKKEERHQIKRDDLATVLERAMIYAEDHLKPIIVIAAVLVIALIGGLLLRNWMKGRTEQASLLVGEMMQSYSMPIVESLEDLAQAPAGVENFTTTEERDQRVLEQADAILDQFSSADTVVKALYYRGLALANLGRFDEAVDSLDRVVRDYPDDFLAPMARYQMARVRSSPSTREGPWPRRKGSSVSPVVMRRWATGKRRCAPTSAFSLNFPSRIIWPTPARRSMSSPEPSVSPALR